MHSIPITFIFFLCLSFPTRYLYARHIAVQIHAPWNRNPLDFIVEIAEFLSDNKNNGVSTSQSNVDLFWQFVDQMCSSSDNVDETVQLLTDSAASKDDIDDSINKIKTLAYGIATSLIPESFHSLMDSMIGLGHYSPAVQFFQSIANNAFDNFNSSTSCGPGHAIAMVLPAKTVFCDWPSLHTYITESSTLSAVSKITVESADFVGSNHLDWDHVHPDLSGGSSGVSVALYGIIGSESFCALHKNLKAAKSDDVSMYTNMEYKNVDDEADKKKDSDALSDEEIRLRERDFFRQRLAEKGGTMKEEEMKVWKMKDLGLQTLKLISSASNQGSALDGMNKFAELAHNFPKMANMISSTKVSTSLRNEEELALTNKLTALKFSSAANQFISQAAIAAHVLKKYSSEKATAFLMDLADHVMNTGQKKNSEELSSSMGFNMYGDSEVEIDIAKADIELVLDSNPGMYADFVSNSSAYVDARGLRANSFSLNGIHFAALHTSIEWALTHPDTRIALILDAEIAQPGQCDQESGSANSTCDAYPLYDTLEIRNAVQYVISTFSETDPAKSSKRYDLQEGLQPFGFEFGADGALTSADFSSLVYNVYPQVMNFAESSLQVVFAVDPLSVAGQRAAASDTLVMQNLGYFQLQANPGLYILNLAEGKATELYDILDGEETLGFQFWSQGFWKDHLQEWLWCETWCSQTSKGQAKTIDLCNSPLHKEPKLDMARRIISGKLFNQSWVELDDEIRSLAIKSGYSTLTE
eukprot:gene27125-35847_t